MIRAARHKYIESTLYLALTTDTVLSPQKLTLTSDTTFSLQTMYTTRHHLTKHHESRERHAFLVVLAGEGVKLVVFGHVRLHPRRLPSQCLPSTCQQPP